MAFSSKLVSAFPWISEPLIIGAPMRVFAGPALATAISASGGLGFIGPNVKTQDTLKDLEEATEIFKKSHGSSSPRFGNLPKAYNLLPVGVGFQLWSDDIEIATEGIRRFRPSAAWLYAPRNGQRDLDLWSDRLRAASPDTQIWVQIGTLREAKELLQSPQKPDGIVVQGVEAGGHGHRDGIGLITLLPEIADVAEGSGIPLFAAGGITDTRGAAAALCLGTSGIVMGTRFLASYEARISKGYQREIIRAEDGGINTVRTLLYNHLRGTTGWPDPYVPRGIINKSWLDHKEGVPFDELKKLHDKAAKAGDEGWGPEGRLATYAGASIGLIHEVRGASEIVNGIRNGLLKVFGRGDELKIPKL
ncbi:hypothetical protein Plec18167_004978 [Paecilomyces lecythidis]|uniref:Nitronate monooxygenase domain-containing protein n=1 Tax=Paecilomyces lecythidis TaxID=3004212 RepID=A0ABR3XNL6_9EURO